MEILTITIDETGVRYFRSSGLEPQEAVHAVNMVQRALLNELVEAEVERRVGAAHCVSEPVESESPVVDG